MIAADVSGFEPDTEFHAYDMFHGEGAWRAVPIGWRIKACKLIATTLANSGAKYVLRGIHIKAHEAKYRRPFPPHSLCTAHSFESVDEVLVRDHEPRAMALVVADEHHSAPDSRRNLRSFKASSVYGYTSKPCRRIADTIYFGPSHASRLLQISDVATFFVNRHETVVESDPRAQAAVEKIFASIMKACRFFYVWAPS